MRVSIHTADNRICVDGEWFETDCATLRGMNISALQWMGSDGWLEYDGHQQPNEVITDFSHYQQFVDNATPLPEPPGNPPPDQPPWVDEPVGFR